MTVGQATFPRATRLLESLQYRAVFARGDRYVSDGFVVIAASRGSAGARLGLALSKRRVRRSVDRNRIKRVVRESFRNVRRELPAADIVVLARSRTATMDNAALAGQLDDIWRRLIRCLTSASSQR